MTRKIVKEAVTFQKIIWHTVVRQQYRITQTVNLACVHLCKPPETLCRYITEGIFRASHRKVHVPKSSAPRHKATPVGHPQHSFNEADSQELSKGELVECHFTMLPTSYCFSPVSLFLS